MCVCAGVPRHTAGGGFYAAAPLARHADFPARVGHRGRPLQRELGLLYAAHLPAHLHARSGTFPPQPANQVYFSHRHLPLILYTVFFYWDGVEIRNQSPHMDLGLDVL